MIGIKDQVWIDCISINEKQLDSPNPDLSSSKANKMEVSEALLTRHRKRFQSAVDSSSSQSEGEVEQFSKISEKPTSPSKEAQSNNNFFTQTDVKIAGVLSVLAVIVRMAFLSNPPVVVFDEVHFGGFAAKYLRHEFFFDVHPPLARLLVALAGWLSGFRGDFNFYEIGVDYHNKSVPYVGMRAFSSIFGLATVPMAYATVTALGGSRMAGIAGGLLVAFENALITQSRLILLDAYLIFFTAAAVLCWSFFRRLDARQEAQFTRGWWSWLAGTGAAIGCAASCKWVGLFTVASIGLQVICSLWRQWTSPLTPLSKIGKHFMARAGLLIVLPVVIYVSTFWVHFAVLSEFSPAAASMTIEFQHSFAGGRLAPTFKPVLYGSTVTIRQVRRDNPGYLHSHDAFYPSGTKQQQVTVYHHQDSNNQFSIRRPFRTGFTYTTKEDEEPMEEEEYFEVRHGDQVRLMHVNTGRFLHSHREPAPISTKKDHHCEISGYGHHPSRFSDLNDNWTVHLVGRNGEALPVSSKREDNPIIRARLDKLIFLHPLAGCVLHSSNKVLPEWGFKQGEVTCGREVLRQHTYWTVETNEHVLHDPAATEKVTYRAAGFWEKFLELNGRMWVVNAGLTSSHYFESRPQSWLSLGRGLGFWNAEQMPRMEIEIEKERQDKNPRLIKNPDEAVKAPTKEEIQAQQAVHKAKVVEPLKGRQIYLIGNFVTWHLVSVVLATSVALAGGAYIAHERLRLAPGFGEWKRGCRRLLELAQPDSASGFLFAGWLLHYLPFFAMARQLYLHHYLPALYCGILFAVMGVESLTVTKWKGRVLAGLVIAAVGAFLLMSPLAYGLPMSPSYCKLIKLRSTWDFNCPDK